MPKSARSRVMNKLERSSSGISSMSSSARWTATKAFIPAHKLTSRPMTRTNPSPCDLRRVALDLLADERELRQRRVDDAVEQLLVVLQHEAQAPW